MVLLRPAGFWSVGQVEHRSALIPSCGTSWKSGLEVQSWNDGPQARDNQINANGILQKPGIYDNKDSKNKGDNTPEKTNWLKHSMLCFFPFVTCGREIEWPARQSP